MLKRISCTCEVIIAHDGHLQTQCSQPTEYVMVHANGGRVAACAEHGAMFEREGITLLLACVEVRDKKGVWV